MVRPVVWHFEHDKLVMQEEMTRAKVAWYNGAYLTQKSWNLVQKSCIANVQVNVQLLSFWKTVHTASNISWHQQCEHGNQCEVRLFTTQSQRHLRSTGILWGHNFASGVKRARPMRSTTIDQWSLISLDNPPQRKVEKKPQLDCPRC